MDNREFLQEMLSRIERGELSSSEVQQTLSLAEPGNAVREEQKSVWRNLDITKVLYFIGAIIVILGLFFFVAQIWEDIGSSGRVFVTFVLGLFLSGIGSALLQKESRKNLGNIFHLLGSLLIFSGTFVIMDEMEIETTAGSMAIVFGALFVFHFFLSLYHKSVLCAFFSIAFGTGFLYAFSEFVLPGYIEDHENFYRYLTMMFGISYFFLSRAFQYSRYVSLSGILNFFGALGFFGAIASFAWNGEFFWEIFFFLILFAGMYLSVFLKSKAIMTLSVLFLIGHFFYITEEYFRDSLGWPLSLVLLGFIVLGIAYSSIRIGKKYLGGTVSDLSSTRSDFSGSSSNDGLGKSLS